jgi:Na+/melibiose symporter-like transporter
MSTLYEAKVVKKNQWMRVFELYGVMLVVIMISYAIYSIFRNKEEPAQANRDEEQLQLVGRRSL